MLFFAKKMQIKNFVSMAVGGLKPSGSGLGLVYLESLWPNSLSVVSKIFRLLNSFSHLGAGVKNVFSKTRFPGWGVRLIRGNLASKTASDNTRSEQRK